MAVVILQYALGSNIYQDSSSENKFIKGNATGCTRLDKIKH
jgi:hypothetical protein